MTQESQESEGYSTREILLAIVITLVIVVICVGAAVAGYGVVERKLIAGSAEQSESRRATEEKAAQQEATPGGEMITEEALMQEGGLVEGVGTSTAQLAVDAAGFALCGGVLVLLVGGIFLLDRYYRQRNS